jgi:hypothetical protein
MVDPTPAVISTFLKSEVDNDAEGIAHARRGRLGDRSVEHVLRRRPDRAGIRGEKPGDAHRQLLYGIG